jgi:hypothetical protein
VYAHCKIARRKYLGAVAVSACSAVLVMVLFVRSTYEQDFIHITGNHRSFTMASAQRLLVVSYTHREMTFFDSAWFTYGSTAAGSRRFLSRPASPIFAFSIGNFVVYRANFNRLNAILLASTSAPIDRWRVTTTAIIPMWFVIALFTVLPVVSAFVFARKRSRRHHNRCLACGYDLRASIDRCPECGTPIG